LIFSYFNISLEKDLRNALAVQYPNIYLDVSNMTYMMPNRLKDFLLYAKELIGLDKILIEICKLHREFLKNEFTRVILRDKHL